MLGEGVRGTMNQQWREGWKAPVGGMGGEGRKP